MTVFIPKGRTCYYVFFRHRKHPYNRSCGTAIYADAVVRAGEIVAEIVMPTPKEAISDPTQGPIEPNRIKGLEIGVEELLGFFDEWIADAIPKRDRTGTKGQFIALLRISGADGSVIVVFF